MFEDLISKFIPVFCDNRNTKKLMNAIKIRFAVLVFIPIFFITSSYADLSVGDSYGGGTVFCVSQTPDITKCIPQGFGNYGLIMANKDQANFDSSGGGVPWTEGITDRDSGTSFDDGLSNTAVIIAEHPEDNPSNNAAWLIHDYNKAYGQEGASDNLTVWYLPAKNELNKMYLYAKSNNLIGKGCTGSKPGGVQCLIGGYDNDEESYSSKYKIYWSSTDDHSCVYDVAWFQNFVDGFQDSRSMVDRFGARAVRAFNNLTIQQVNHLPKPQLRQVVERFIHDAEEARRVDIDRLREMLQGIPDAETLLPILDWLRTNRTIKTLNLANIDLRTLIAPLSDLLAVRTDFTTIDLTNCNLDTVAIRRLLQNCRKLTHLYLGWNNIEGSEEEVCRLRNARWDGLLKGLDLLRDPEVMLTELLQHNPGLTVLDLRANRIGMRGIEVLSRMLPNNPPLTRLNLENNLVGDEEITKLARMLQNNTRLTTIYLGWNDINHSCNAEVLFGALQRNPSLIVYDLHNNSISEKMKARLSEIYSKKILLKLLRKIKRASSFTFMIGLRYNLTRHVLPQILEYAGLNVHNRAAFEDVRDYDTEENRRIIFNGTLEEVIRLFYYGNHADYAETIREINQLRREQREFLQGHGQEIPAGQLLELAEGLLGARTNILTPERIAATFWSARGSGSPFDFRPEFVR